jgi:hypothetical protein
VYADGAPSIASGTPITLGLQQFGNSANATTPGYNGDIDGHFHGGAVCGGASLTQFWSLQVVSGDQILTDWEAPQQQFQTRLTFLPVGTTDYELATVQPIAASEVAANGKAELRYTATRSGSMPVAFCRINNEPGGPYDFTIYARHAVRLALRAPVALHDTGNLKVHVSDPDGLGITSRQLTIAVQARSGGAWKTLGTAKPSHGVAAVHYSARSLPAGRYDLRLRAHGSSFVTTDQTVRGGARRTP